MIKALCISTYAYNMSTTEALLYERGHVYDADSSYVYAGQRGVVVQHNTGASIMLHYVAFMEHFTIVPEEDVESMPNAEA